MTIVADLPTNATAPVSSASAGIAGAKPEDRPDFERPALQRMKEHWKLPDYLMGGTTAMQEAKTEVLPREPDETEEEYDRRRLRTVLTNYYGNTIEAHSGMPFSEPITFDPPLPARLAYLERDADGCGRSLTVLMRDCLREAMHRGLTHVLVDVPIGQGEDYAATLKRQPRLFHIHAPSVLGVEDEPSEDGEADVTYLRFMQRAASKVGRYGAVEQQSIKEIEILGASGLVREYRRPLEGGDWVVGADTAYTRAEIPFHTLYAKQEGPYEGKPAYLPLAELNKAHYQSDADQRHALSYGRRATVVQTGWKENNASPIAAAAGLAAQTPTVLGYGRKMRHSNDDAKAYLLETGGAPLAAGRDDLAGLEQRMERFGAQQVSKDGGITATARKLDRKQDTCNLEAWCTRLEDVTLAALRDAAKWIGLTLPENQAVKVPRTFSDEGPTDEQMPVVLQMGTGGYLTRSTVVKEAKARGILVTVDDPEIEAEEAKGEREADAEAEIDRLVAQTIEARPPAAGAPSPADDPAAAASP